MTKRKFQLFDRVRVKPLVADEIKGWRYISGRRASREGVVAGFRGCYIAVHFPTVPEGVRDTLLLLDSELEFVD